MKHPWLKLKFWQIIIFQLEYLNINKNVKTVLPSFFLHFLKKLGTNNANIKISFSFWSQTIQRHKKIDNVFFLISKNSDFFSWLGFKLRSIQSRWFFLTNFFTSFSACNNSTFFCES